MQTKSALNIHINFSSVVRFLAYSSNSSVRIHRVQTSTEIHGLSKRELLGPAADLVAVH